MANYTQPNLLIPIIIALGNSNKELTTEELYPILERMLLPWGEDLNSYKNRTDTIFSQTIRNFTAPERLTEFNKKFIYVENGKISLTDFGKQIHRSLLGNCKISPSKNNSQNINFDKYLVAIQTKPFLLLAGISGTGKSRIVRELAFKSCPSYLRDKDGTSPGNYCMIEVKPNWHDSSELLGYHSNIAGKYQFKKFVRFLVKAKMFPDVPFFVCLDEMNLAPVEQYFAEILSILETRKHPKNPDSEEPDMSIISSGVIIEPEHFQKLGELSFAKTPRQACLIVQNQLIAKYINDFGTSLLRKIFLKVWVEIQKN